MYKEKFMSSRNNEFCWNDSITLKEYFEAKLGAVEKSITIATNALDRRLEGMNEFRDSLKDQASKFVTRTEMDLKFESLDKNRKDSTALLVSLLALLVGVLSTVIRVWK